MYFHLTLHQLLTPYIDIPYSAKCDDVCLTSCIQPISQAVLIGVSNHQPYLKSKARFPVIGIRVFYWSEIFLFTLIYIEHVGNLSPVDLVLEKMFAGLLLDKIGAQLICFIVESVK